MASDRHHVAMGSSYAAGPGIPPVLDRGALRSGRNYAHLVAERLGATLDDVTCSSAVTANLLDTPQRVGRGRRAPQVEALRHHTDLVTITAGGNDLGYIGALSRCWIANAVRAHLPVIRRRPAPDDPVPPADLGALADSLARLLAEIRRRSPSATVVLTDYLTVLGDDVEGWDGLRLGSHQVASLRAVAAGLTATLRAAAEAHDAVFVAASELNEGHGLGSAEPWVTGLVMGNPWKGGPVPFHPNALGHAALADAIVARIS